MPTAAVAQDCVLPPIKPGGDLAITFSFDAEPDTPDGNAIGVSLGGLEPEAVPLTVTAGITELAADPKLTLPANGIQQEVTLTAKPAADGVDLGSVTVTSPADAVTVACVGGGQTCPVAGDHTVTLAVTVSEKQPPGPLTLVATDAGKRDIPVRPITVLGAPKLTVIGPTMNVRPVPGGQGVFSVTVSNTGDSASAGGDPLTVSVTTPLTVVGIDAGGTSLCTAPFTDCRLPRRRAQRDDPGLHRSGTGHHQAGRLPADGHPARSAAVDHVQRAAGRHRRGRRTRGSLSRRHHTELDADRVGTVGDSTDPGPVTLTSSSDRVTLSGCGSTGVDPGLQGPAASRSR